MLKRYENDKYNLIKAGTESINHCGILAIPDYDNQQWELYDARKGKPFLIGVLKRKTRSSDEFKFLDMHRDWKECDWTEFLWDEDVCDIIENLLYWEEWREIPK